MIQKKIFLIIVLISLIFLTTNIFACSLEASYYVNNEDSVSINLNDNIFFKLENESQTIGQNGENIKLFYVSKNSTLDSENNIDTIAKNNSKFSINFEANNCNDFEKVVIKVHGVLGWTFNIQDRLEILNINFKNNNLETILELEGASNQSKNLFFNINNNMTRINLKESIIEFENPMHLISPIDDPILFERLSTIININVDKIKITGSGQIKIVENQRNFRDNSNKKIPYGVDFIFNKIDVQPNSKLIIDIFSEGHKDRSGSSGKSANSPYSSSGFFNDLRNNWYSEFSDNLSLNNNFENFFNVWEKYSISRSDIHSRDGHSGGIIFMKGKEINNYGDLEIKLEGGPGSNAPNGDERVTRHGFYGGIGGDVFLIVDSINNIENGLFELSLLAGSGGKGGNSSNKSANVIGARGGGHGGAGGLGGSSFLKINNLYATNTDFLEFNLFGGHGGNGGTSRNRSKKNVLASNNYFDGGYGGHGGHAYLDISQINFINVNSFNVDLVSGDGGQGGNRYTGDGSSDNRTNTGQGGNSGFIFVDSFKSLNNVNFFSETNQNIKFNLTVGERGERAENCETKPEWCRFYGYYGGISNIEINDFFDNSNNFKIIKNNKITIEKLQEYISNNDLLEFYFNEHYFSGSDITINLKEGSYLPNNLEIRSIDNENIYEMYDSKINLIGCYINNNLQKTYFSESLSITSSNNYYFIDNIFHPNKENVNFVNFINSNNQNCNFCMATDLKDNIYRTNKDLYVYSKEELENISLEIYLKISNNTNIPLYETIENITGEFNEKLGLYVYEISKQNLKPSLKKSLPFWYPENYSFTIEDKLFCYGQEYLIKIKNNDDTEYGEFPFTILFEDY